jgi:transposase
MSPISRETIEIAYQAGVEAIIRLIEEQAKQIIEQAKQISELVKRIEELEDQKAKNSKNSDKPPSGDGFGKQTKSLRVPSGKQSGGQEGHKGHNLKWEENADTVIRHQAIACHGCGEDLREITGEIVEQRQVHDLPVIKLEVTEHQVERKICPHCQLATTSRFPSTVPDWVQYGSRVKGIVTYLNQYQLIPSQRTQELMEDIFGCEISEGTIYNQVQKCSEVLEPVEIAIKEKLTGAEVAHFDETGVRVESKVWWMHVCSTKTHTHYQVHKKRGAEAMDEIGILPKFKGKAVHDGWKSYSQYECLHHLCNAHHMRELVFIHERFNQPWAEEMIQLLCKIYDAVKKSKLEGKTTLEVALISSFESEFQAIIDKGYESNPEISPLDAVKTKGRPKRSKALNLIRRLDLQRKQALGFMYDFAVPFDNNLAERDIRMTKLKLKISGTFRSELGARAFARIRGYISTLKKQGLNILDALTQAFLGNPLFV